jgi:hypothetical protein
MIDQKKLADLRGIAQGQVERAEKYAQARERAGRAESQLKIILASKLKNIRKEKKNVGIDMAILMLCEDDEVARKLSKELIEQEAIYKGLERVLDAVASVLIFEQSLMKFVGNGEKYG